MFGNWVDQQAWIMGQRQQNLPTVATSIKAHQAKINIRKKKKKSQNKIRKKRPQHYDKQHNLH